MSSSTASRRSLINTDEENYHPLAIHYTKKDGTPSKCDVVCGLNLKDFILIVGCYIAFYSFLFGLSALLLKGVIATNETDAFLWGFLVIGVVFCIGVMLAVLITTRSDQKKMSEKQKKIETKVEKSDEENQETNQEYTFFLIQEVRC